jgi:legumain
MLSTLAGALSYTDNAPRQTVEQASAGAHWAVLIAGSHTFANYRHQSDVCHAYHVITKAGIPEENIIVIASDDIANARQNPFPGQIFNKPSANGEAGFDVYKGCKIDYSGADVTPEVFTKVLTGEATNTGSGKVLKSTSSDKVFVNFVDHGGVGTIGFPQTTMHVKDLTAAFTTMHKNNMYSELTFYLETCESGSMCKDQGLEDMNIYCTTAANEKESSWGTYCGSDAMVNGKNVGSCLGDLYSVNWMEDSDTQDITSETLKTQFDTVVKLTAKSHVTAYGKTSIGSEMVAEFQGDAKIARPAPSTSDHKSAMKTYDATLWSHFHQFTENDDEEAGLELIKGVQDRLDTKKRFAAIAKAVSGNLVSATPFGFEGKLHTDCHYEAHKAYKATCGEFSDAAMSYSGALAQMCQHTDGDATTITAAITAACL